MLEFINRGSPFEQLRVFLAMAKTVFSSPQELTLAVGKELGTSGWIQVTDKIVALYVQSTGDDQWIHTDHNKAKNGPFGGCIAQGFLTLSLLNRLLPEILEVKGVNMAINYGCNKVRFPAPVMVGTNIRVHAKLIAASTQEESIESIILASVEIEGMEKPGCVAELVARYY